MLFWSEQIVYISCLKIFNIIQLGNQVQVYLFYYLLIYLSRYLDQEKQSDLFSHRAKLLPV